MTLAEFVGPNPFKRARAMNWLQWEGIVSDCAVWPEDVSAEDHARAIGWLRAHPGWRDEHDFSSGKPESKPASTTGVL